MPKKKKTNITTTSLSLDGDIVKSLREEGLNLSKIVRKYLKDIYEKGITIKK